MPTSIVDRILAFGAGLRDLSKRSALLWRSWRHRAEGTSEAAYVGALGAAEPSRRWIAAETLGRNPLRSAEAIKALIGALCDDEPFVRWQVAESLATQEPGRVFPALVEALNDPEPLCRAGVAQALGNLGGEAAALVLVKQLADTDPRVRAAVAAALGRIADPTTAAPLLRLLEDSEPDVVRAAARGLGRIGSTVAAVPLVKALARPDQPVLVRRAISAALSHVPHPDAQPQLLTALLDPDPQVRGYAAHALGQVGNETTHAALEALRSDNRRLLRGTVATHAAQALSMLERRGRRGQVVHKQGESRHDA